ncbi:LacI family DNA-binding transcriptional regulator [Ruegeria arenilitoris]|uniref:LacI family DNA-binding transcriptional regulator n=1 Tax=Ruegeria arenilitoris TaxID=1173585 RepID=UPI001C2B9E15|nr:LacI family DNA-binding transcriptional regulator [Ruegeria arenilitoris]
MRRDTPGLIRHYAKECGELKGYGQMARATIADIAGRAGLSTATVDRALNGRKGVSAANRQRVLRAARSLGYLPSEGMFALPSRPARLGFLVPFGGNAFMQEVTDAITRFADAQPLVERCSIIALNGIGPDAFADGLDQVPSGTDGLGVITTDHPRTREALRRICESGMRVVTLASDVLATPRADYIGVDNLVAGRTAAQILGMLTRGQTGSVAIFCGSQSFAGHREREYGFRSCLQEFYPNLQALAAIETSEDGDRLNQEMRRLLRTQPDLLGVYCAGAGRKGLIQVLETTAPTARPHVVLHDLTEDTRQWLVDGQVDAVIDQNARLIGEQAVLRLLGAIASGSVQLPLQHIEPRIILRENIPAGQSMI